MAGKSNTPVLAKQSLPLESLPTFPGAPLPLPTNKLNQFSKAAPGVYSLPC